MSQNLATNRVRVLGNEPHTPTAPPSISGSNPPPHPPEFYIIDEGGVFAFSGPFFMAIALRKLNTCPPVKTKTEEIRHIR